MNLVRKKDTIILLLGDILCLFLALWAALFVRNLKLPSLVSFEEHLVAFLPIFCFWVLIFFVFGLYERYSSTLKNKLPDNIFNSIIFNFFIALAFFYLTPKSNITPKTNLILIAIFSVIFIIIWRVYIFGLIKKNRSDNVIILSDSFSAKELFEEIKKSGTYGVEPILITETKINILEIIEERNIKDVIFDFGFLLKNNQFSLINKILFKGINMIDIEDAYESIFGRVSLERLSDEWFLNNKPNRPLHLYHFLKRIMDLILASFAGLFSLIFYPFVYLAIKIEDGGPIFIIQERAGKNGRPIKIIKFRSMTTDDKGKWVVKNDPRITKVGSFLRKSRIDELPQLWNVIKGDISLIGPRPELPKFVEIYDNEIPYYGMRHLIKPGLSGWAQIHHEKPPQSVEETKEKLAYDLYYIKYRSIMLDIEIALKTIKTLLSRTGM